MNRETTCCFTGHRPEKLPWREDEGDPRCLELKARLAGAVEAAYEKGMRHFLCGMARGADFYCCEAALALRERRPGVTVEAEAEVRDSIVMPGAVIKKGAKVQYAIVAENAVIGEGAVVGARPEDCGDAKDWGVAVVAAGIQVGAGSVIPPKVMIDADTEGGEGL